MHKIIYIGLLFLLNIGVTFANNSFAYITNAAAPGHISICQLNSTTGQFEHCSDSYLNALSAPLDVAFATFDNTTYAYIVNSTYPAFVTRCIVNDHNALQYCAATDVPSYAGIALQQSDQLYAYLSDTTSVKKCAVTPDGQLNNRHCRDSGAGNIFSNGPVYIKFQTFNNITYAYIANGDFHPNASVIQCRVQANGDFANCINAALGTYFNGAADVDFVTLGEKTYAYVTQSGGAVAKCDVNPQTGLFTDCTNTGGTFYTPVGISVTKIANKHYAYIVDGGFRPPYANAVSQCAINALGDLDCVDSGAGKAFASPFGIAMQCS